MNQPYIATRYKAGEKNARRLLEMLGGEGRTLYCGLSAYDAYRLTDRLQCMERKKHLYDRLMKDGGEPGAEKLLSEVLRVCLPFLPVFAGEERGKKGPAPALSEIDPQEADPQEVLWQSASSLYGARRTAWKCFVATLYLSALGAHVSSPPLRLPCMQFTPDRLRAVTGTLPSLQKLLEERFFGRTEEDYTLLFEMPDRADASLLMETGCGLLLLCEKGAPPENYDFLVNFVDEACAVYDPKGLLAPENGRFTAGENRFLPLHEELLRELVV